MNKDENLTVEDTTPASMGDVGSETLPAETQSEAANDLINNPAVTAYIEKAIAEGIQKALKGTPPKANTANPTEQEFKQFEKMTYKERLNLFNSNPQSYYKLSKGG